MSGDKAVIAFMVGLLILVADLQLAQNYFPPDAWAPTLIYLVALVLLLVGQLWLLGAFMEDSGSFEWMKVGLFVLLCVLPYASVVAGVRETGYAFMRWSAIVLLSVESLVFVMSLLDMSRFQRAPTAEEIAEAQKSRKRNLPG